MIELVKHRGAARLKAETHKKAEFKNAVVNSRDQPPPSRMARKKERTRRLLLDVALALFYEKGIYWTKIEDITERADVGKGTFYQYFDTKEALLQALIEEGLERLLTRMREAVGDAKTGPALIGRVIRARLEFFVENPEYLLLLHQIRGLLQLTAESGQELRQIYTDHFIQLGELLRPALKARASRIGSPSELAMTLAAFTSGLLTYHLLFDEHADFPRRRDEIQTVLERSLVALL